MNRVRAAMVAAAMETRRVEVTHAGIAIVAGDTGRVLMAQRAMDETDDPEVQQTWEFPGGGLEENEQPFVGAQREFLEEVMLPFPQGTVVDVWYSGVYQGFVYLMTSEFDLDEFTPNGEVQSVGWFDESQVRTLEAAKMLRPELAASMDWSLIWGVSGNQGEQAMTEAVFNAHDFVASAIPIHGVIAPEDTESGDRRGFAKDAMSARPMRLPFAWQKSSVPGHDGSVVIGSIDRMMRKDGLIHWEGSLMMSADASEFLDLLMFFDGRYGLSVDGDKGSLDKFRSETSGITWFDAVRIAGATAVAVPAFHEAYVALGNHPTMPGPDTALAASMYDENEIVGDRVYFDRGPGWVTNPKETKRLHDYWTKKGEEGYAKINWGNGGDYRRCVALVGEKIAKNSPEDVKYLKRICAQWHHDALGYWPGELGKPGNNPKKVAASAEDNDVDVAAVARMVAESDLDGFESPEGTESAWEAVLVSSAAGTRVRPPLEYFNRHPDTGATVIEEPDAFGFRRTHGYAAEWGVCHIGFEGRCVEPPQTGSDDYPEFHLGRTRVATAEGEGIVNTGLLTYNVEHRNAQRILTETATQSHFDNLRHAWAAVRVGEDERGIWFSGVVLPKVDEDDITIIQASGQVSGEWKYGAMRACLTVNVPGFPVVSASAEYDEDGNVLALAASAFGQVADAPCNQIAESDDDQFIGDLSTAVWARMQARDKMDDVRAAFAADQFEKMRAEFTGGQ